MRIMSTRYPISALAFIVLNVTLLLSLLSCSVNPVTGKQELAWVDENWERNIGEQHYSHQQQAGGGHTWEVEARRVRCVTSSHVVIYSIYFR